MLFPDTRLDENYNEDFLNDKDKEFIKGYDCALQSIKNLFENLDTYEDELRDDEDIINLPAVLTKYNERIIKVIESEHESERDELITSALDAYSEEDYERYKAYGIALNEQRPQAEQKHYHDTRSFR